MKSKLIILRGNSGSGKSTIAKKLQHHFGHGTLLVSQDTVRRDMLNVKDRDGNRSIELIRQIAAYGKDRCEVVIVEGILYAERYGEMLRELIQTFNNKAYVFYFDLTFEETLRRHNSRAKKDEFGEESLRAWWNSNDVLSVENEMVFKDEQTEDEVMNIIFERLEE